MRETKESKTTETRTTEPRGQDNTREDSKKTTKHKGAGQKREPTRRSYYELYTILVHQYKTTSFEVSKEIGKNHES